MNPCDNCNCEDTNECPFEGTFEDKTPEIPVIYLEDMADLMESLGYIWDDYAGYTKSEDS